MTSQEGQIKSCIWTLEFTVNHFPFKTSVMNNEQGEQCSSIAAGEGSVSYLIEPVRLRGAERLISQLQQLL